MPRYSWALLCVAFVALSSGCVEMTQTFTLNPDGRGKVEIDMVQPAFVYENAADKKKKKKTLAEMKQESVTSFLTAATFKQATAWKDVSADWLPDGRLHIVGTAYFERLSDLIATDQMGMGPTYAYWKFEKFSATTGDDGTFKLFLHKDDKILGDKTDADPTKMTDKQLDEFILEQRVNYQSNKGVVTLILADLKIKTIFRMPGEIRDVVGFKKDSDKVVSRELDGNAVLRSMSKLMAEDNAALKKRVRQARSVDDLAVFMSMGSSEVKRDGSLTVAKGKPQFAYDKEVAQARAAYPQLRKDFNIAEDKLLPGDKIMDKK